MVRILGCTALRFWLFVGVIVGSLINSSAPAHAQRAPDMATLDRGDGISKLGLDVAYSFLNSPPYESALRLEAYGQLVTRSGFGIYGALPLASSFGDVVPDPLDMFPDEATVIGNLELGGLYVATVSPQFALVLRGGLALPIGSSGRDAAATLGSATLSRLTDLALATDAFYLRLGVSPLIYADRLFFRADLGVDLGMEANSDTFARVNLGIGYDAGPVALGLELVNLATSGGAFGNDESFLHTLAFTLRFMGKLLQPYLAVGTPLDDSGRNAVDLFIAGGIQVVP